MRKLSSLIVFAFASTLLLTGCRQSGDTDNLDDAPKFVEQTLMDYKVGRYESMRLSDGWSNGEPFDVTWSSKNVLFEEEGLSLTITKGDTVYNAGEISTANDDAFYQYGYFGTYMKPAAVDGTASTFFTYTGESDENPHDEIDIEFLGKDTTKVQFNYFVEGKGEHEYMYELGFDASKEVHQYGFYWDDKQIVWYVDLKPVYRVRSGKMPSHAQRIYSNFWKGTPSVKNWMGSFDDKNLGCKAFYTKSTYADLDGKGKTLEPSHEETYDLSNATAVDLEFQGNDCYTIEKKDGVTEVTYTEVEDNSYQNVFAPFSEEIGKNNNLVAFDLENKGEATANIRIDVNYDAQPEGAKHRAANVKALVLGGDEVRTDLEWGGSFFTVAPNEKFTGIILYEGTPKQFMAMIDSAYASTTATHAGKILLSNFRFALHGEKEAEPETSSEPASSGEPSTSSASEEAKGVTLTFQSTEDYTVVNSNGTADITYSGVTWNSYKNFSAGIDASQFGTSKKLGIKVQNLGEAAAKIRFDICGDSGNLEKSIVAPGCEGVFADADYGGAYLVIPAGVTSDVQIGFDGTPTYMLAYIDSTWFEDQTDTTPHSGHLLFSDYQAL